jgi:hypothetical protein
LTQSRAALPKEAFIPSSDFDSDESSSDSSSSNNSASSTITVIKVTGPPPWSGTLKPLDDIAEKQDDDVLLLQDPEGDTFKEDLADMAAAYGTSTAEGGNSSAGQASTIAPQFGPNPAPFDGRCPFEALAATPTWSTSRSSTSPRETNGDKTGQTTMPSPFF